MVDGMVALAAALFRRFLANDEFELTGVLTVKL
jgi:hypothetical protein